MLDFASTATFINQSQSFSMSEGCLLEYNMNDLIDNVEIKGENPDSITITQTAADGVTKYKPFEKLFPLTSIIDPRRPKTAGIQYMILGDPSVKKTLESGIGSYDNYASSKTFAKRLYFSSIKTAYKYWVSPPSKSDKTLSNCILKVLYPEAKKATTNKIVIKFETSHSKPTSWTLKLNGSVTPIFTGTTCPDNGVVNVYYNGSTWTETEPADIVSGVDITELKLQVNSVDQAASYLGIIEISARYVVDITDKLKSMRVSQSASDSTSGLVPVGNVTANSLTVSIFAYDDQYAIYDQSQKFNKAKLNLYKNIIVKPYIYIDTQKINIGKFYLDSFTTAEYGEIDLTALDGARELQFIKPPDIITKDMSSVAIIRRLLDSIGFTNYYFNLPADGSDSATIKPVYWFTDPNKTVWQHIQDLCQDTQMIASFDNNDILQFYPRDYIFKNTGVKASFRSESKDGSLNLPNILSMSVEAVPSVKAIKVVYNSQLSSSYLQNADPLYISPPVTLGAASLLYDINPTQPVIGKVGDSDYAPNGVIQLQPVITSGEAQKLYSYSGYLVIQKEIIEYDAIQYQYTPLDKDENGNNKPPAYMWITSESDVQKHQGLAQPNTFKPTAKYRIKARNVFNTVDPTDLKSLTHIATSSTELAKDWTARSLDIIKGTPGPIDESLFTLKDIEVTSKVVNGVQTFDRPHNLLNSISKSMLTVFAPDGTPIVNTDPTKPQGWEPNSIYSFVADDANYKDSENFVIGTNMYFPLIVDTNTGNATGNQKTIAGLAFSLNSDNTSGYLLTIQTTQSFKADETYRDVNFYKIESGKLKPLKNSQTVTGGTIITNINGGELYRIDIRGNYSVPQGSTSNKKVLALKILLNNKTFAVFDSDVNLPLTDRVALVSGSGTVAFDYIYTSPIKKEEFLSNASFDLYKGLIGGESTLIKNFSDFVFSEGEKLASPIWVNEFGPVARELRRIQTRYSGPGFPRYPSLIQNTDVTIVGSSLDSFTMDTFVMNNTGVFTELSNGAEKKFIIVGDYVSQSDPFEYMDPTLTDAEKAEQVGFESTWIQNESDAKALAIWMKDTWSHQQKVLTMDVFINPLLQIGDIIQVSYPKSRVYSSEDVVPEGYSAEKFVILSLDTSYDKDSQPSTKIVCRSIFTS
jgi:hypothetical protein